MKAALSKIQSFFMRWFVVGVAAFVCVFYALQRQWMMAFDWFVILSYALREVWTNDELALDKKLIAQLQDDKVELGILLDNHRKLNRTLLKDISIDMNAKG